MASKPASTIPAIRRLLFLLPTPHNHLKWSGLVTLSVAGFPQRDVWQTMQVTVPGLVGWPRSISINLVG